MGETMNNLRLLRENAGISQQRLGELLDVSQQTINKYESGQSQAGYDILIQLSNIFSVPVEALIDDDIELDRFLDSLKLHLTPGERVLLYNFRRTDRELRDQVFRML